MGSKFIEQKYYAEKLNTLDRERAITGLKF